MWDKPLKEIWGGSAAPYALTAGALKSLLAHRKAVHAESIDLEQAMNISAWLTEDGRFHLLAGNLEEGLRDDAGANRHTAIELPAQWRSLHWSSVWGGREPAASGGKLSIDLGQAESVQWVSEHP
jgi:hypothetical protein